MIAGIVAIAIGSILWAVIGPYIVLIGRPTPTHERVFFEAYSWLSYPPPIAEVSSTYWLGFAISLIGLSILAVGVIGIILAAVMEMRAPESG